LAKLLTENGRLAEAEQVARLGVRQHGAVARDDVEFAADVLLEVVLGLVEHDGAENHDADPAEHEEPHENERSDGAAAQARFGGRSRLGWGVP
jgi:hypothetical protein